jgi:hypothetical protein
MILKKAKPQKRFANLKVFFYKISILLVREIGQIQKL